MILKNVLIKMSVIKNILIKLYYKYGLKFYVIQ